jgi:hyperosmotically inducible protein
MAKITNRFSALTGMALAAMLVLSAVAFGANTNTDDQTAASPMARQIRKQLVTLPYYGVFDNLAYKVEGSTVTLYGQVVKPITRSDAEKRVVHVEGVTKVVNNIEVLPLSSIDNAIRVRTYRAVFGRNGLYRYAMGAVPSIHIIVDNGHVTLEGVVSSKTDSQLAYMAANGVPGVFSVTNNLQVE